MSDLLKDSSTWLEAQCAAFRTSTVTYRRGVATVEVDAEVGHSDFDIVSDEGVVEQWESRDFLIAAADLILGGVEVLPAIGDEIVETIGSDDLVYSVMAPTSDQPPWRYSDQWRITLRVHTKHTATE